VLDMLLFLLFVGALCALVAGWRALPIRAEQTPPRPETTASPTRPCLDDALGRRYCARGPGGSAVSDPLGRILCAAGACVELEGVWHCAHQPRGGADLTGEGRPVCEGGCAPPKSTECEEIAVP